MNSKFKDLFQESSLFDDWDYEKKNYVKIQGDTGNNYKILEQFQKLWTIVMTHAPGVQIRQLLYFSRYPTVPSKPDSL